MAKRQRVMAVLIGTWTLLGATVQLSAPAGAADPPAPAAVDAAPPGTVIAPRVLAPLAAPTQSQQPAVVPAGVEAVGLERGAGPQSVLTARPDGSAVLAGSAPIYVDPPPPVPKVPSDAALAALRACESHGNYGSVSAGGHYRGAYQFAQSTWNSVASRWFPSLVGIDPARASTADQDAMARALFAEAGWAPWPTCGRG